jgi:hypothetical protein
VLIILNAPDPDFLRINDAHHLREIRSAYKSERRKHKLQIIAKEITYTLKHPFITGLISGEIASSEIILMY